MAFCRLPPSLARIGPGKRLGKVAHSTDVAPDPRVARVEHRQRARELKQNQVAMVEQQTIIGVQNQSCEVASAEGAAKP